MCSLQGGLACRFGELSGCVREAALAELQSDVVSLRPEFKGQLFRSLLTLETFVDGHRAFRSLNDRRRGDRTDGRGSRTSYGRSPPRVGWDGRGPGRFLIGSRNAK